MKNMGADFLSRYIQLADGEKDPRNLMVAFAIARVIGVEFDISQHVERAKEYVNSADLAQHVETVKQYLPAREDVQARVVNVALEDTLTIALL